MLFLRYIESLLRNIAPPFPLHRFSSVEALSFATVRRFSRVSLLSARKGLGAGLIAPPLEAQYQDEFYRACYEVLDNYVYLTSELSGQLSGGRVDFQIKSIGWAIECVRDGDRLDDHVERFLPGGKYHSWMKSGEIQQHILLDFRKSKPKRVRGMITNRIYRS